MTDLTDRNRIGISVTPEMRGYLDDIAKTGIYGKNRPEVAKSLISREIERLIREGIIKLRSK